MIPPNIEKLKEAYRLMGEVLAESPIEVGENTSDPLSYDTLAKQFDWVSDYYKTAQWTHEQFVGGGTPELLHLDKTMTTDDVRKVMEEKGHRPATAFEAIAWANENPYGQRKYPIVALGSVARFGGGRHVVCLSVFGRQRSVDLSWIGDDDGWNSSCRFVVFDK